MTQTQEFFSTQIDSSTASSQDLTYEAWFRRKVEAGIQDAREGREISNEEMEAKADALCNELIFKSSMS
ncbi:MAG: hypothetical protein IKO41_04165 [Lachnospiraceae bacterium]|nr:hypothetical protein [Lachnospiraceae bacterium]